jgi:hypothetical protein
MGVQRLESESDERRIVGLLSGFEPIGEPETARIGESQLATVFEVENQVGVGEARPGG